MLTINTNKTSLIVQRGLINSTFGLNNAIERMSTGSKINHARDNAANYSISTNLSTRLSSFEVASDNTENGLNLIMTASDSLDLVSNHLSRMRDLCEQAANGTYGKESLNSIQCEIESRLDECYRIMDNAEFNGIKLFDDSPTQIPLTTKSSGSTLVSSPPVSNYGVGFMKEVSRLTKEQAIAENYTIIENASDLQNMKVNDPNAKYILMGDIDLSSIDNWTPIGQDRSNAFQGELNGNGYKIKNLKINSSSENVGLFGYIAHATIKNIALENVNVKSDKGHAGGLTGYLNYSEISNCYVTGTLQNNACVGGLVGYTDGGSIENSSSQVTVTGGNYVGGFGGVIRSSMTNVVSNSFVSGNENVGGLAGATGGYAKLTRVSSKSTVKGVNCIGGLIGDLDSYTQVTDSSSESIVSGVAVVGGFAGLQTNFSEMINCSSKSTVSGQNIVGGLVGRIMHGSDISDCSSKSIVSGNDNIGGLVGACTGYYACNISNSIAGGSVLGKGSYIGGLLGFIKDENHEILNCSSTCSVIGKKDVGALVGVTTSFSPGIRIVNSTYSSIENPGMKVIGANYAKVDESGISASGENMKNHNQIGLQVGIDSDSDSRINVDTGFYFALAIAAFDAETARMSLGKIDKKLDEIKEKQTQLGAGYNRLESALESIGVNIDNLTSTRSTIKDADIAEVSSSYIKNQILQQASATLLATVNQSPSIVLSLI